MEVRIVSQAFAEARAQQEAQDGEAQDVEAQAQGEDLGYVWR